MSYHRLIYSNSPVLTGVFVPLASLLSWSSFFLSDWSFALAVDLVLNLLLVGLISVEEEIWKDLPVLAPWELTLEAENLPGEEPHDKTHGHLVLGVAWDDAVDIGEVSVAVAESDAWDVGVGSLADGLGVGVWIANDDEPWFDELALDGVVGEETWGEPLVDAHGAKELRELVDSTLAEWLGGDGEDIAWLLNSVDHTGSKLDLLPNLAKVEDVSTAGLGENVWLHSERAVGRTNVHLGGEHLPDSVFALNRHLQRLLAQLFTESVRTNMIVLVFNYELRVLRLHRHIHVYLHPL